MSAEMSEDKLDMVDNILDNCGRPRDGGLAADPDGVAYDETQCNRWSKHGHDRLYFDDHDGYIDLQTAEVHDDTPVASLTVEDGMVVYHAEDIDNEYPVAKCPVGGI